MPIWNLPDWILFEARTGLNPMKLPMLSTPAASTGSRQPHLPVGDALLASAGANLTDFTETNTQTADVQAANTAKTASLSHITGMHIQPLVWGLLLSLSLSLCALPGQADPAWHTAPKIPPREYAPIAPVPEQTAPTPNSSMRNDSTPDAGIHPVSNTAPFAGYNQEQAATWRSAGNEQRNAAAADSRQSRKGNRKDHPVVVAPIPLLPETPPPDDWVRPTGNSSQSVPLPGSTPVSAATGDDGTALWQEQTSKSNDTASNNFATIDTNDANIDAAITATNIADRTTNTNPDTDTVAMDTGDAIAAGETAAPVRLYYYPRVAPAHMPDSESDRPTNVLTLAPSPSEEAPDNAMQMLSQDEAQMTPPIEQAGASKKERDPAFALIDKFFGPAVTANKNIGQKDAQAPANAKRKTTSSIGNRTQLQRHQDSAAKLSGNNLSENISPEAKRGNDWSPLATDTREEADITASEGPETPVNMANLADEVGTSISFKAYSKDKRKREAQLKQNATRQGGQTDMYGEMSEDDQGSTIPPTGSMQTTVSNSKPAATTAAKPRPMTGKNKPMVSFPEPLMGGNSGGMSSGNPMQPGSENAAIWDSSSATDETPVAKTNQNRSTRKTAQSADAVEPGMVPVSWSSPRVSAAEALRHYNRAAYFGQQDQIDEAIAEYKDAILSNAGFADAYVGLSTAYMRKNDWENVIRQAEKAMSLKEGMMDPANIAQAQYNLGAAYCAADDFDKAKTYYEILHDTAAPNARQLWNFMVRTCKP